MQSLYKNVVQIKQLGNEYYKVSVCKNIITGHVGDQDRVKKGEAGHDKKLKHSLSRTKTQVFEKAICNDWNWFCTLTLDGSKYKRDDLDTFIKDLSQFIRDKRKEYGISINYLLIPELHKDGKNWHMHGLISDIPSSEIEPHPKKSLALKGYINWGPYLEKFGFNSFGAIRDNVRCALYITKYITKGINANDGRINKKLYYCSRGLKTAPKICEGQLIKPIDFDMAFKGLYSQSMYVNSIEWFKEYFQTYEKEE